MFALTLPILRIFARSRFSITSSSPSKLSCEESRSTSGSLSAELLSRLALGSCG